jgi:hypothetical protein
MKDGMQYAEELRPSLGGVPRKVLYRTPIDGSSGAGLVSSTPVLDKHKKFAIRQTKIFGSGGES